MPFCLSHRIAPFDPLGGAHIWSTKPMATDEFRRCEVSVTTSGATPTPGIEDQVVEGVMVAKFVTIGYGDSVGYDRTDPDVRDAAHAQDEHLRVEGADMGIAGIPVQVRNHDAAGVEVATGPFMQSSLPVAGFAVIDAATVEDAVELVSRTPCAVAHGVVEVWPLEQVS